MAGQMSFHLFFETSNQEAYPNTTTPSVVIRLSLSITIKHAFYRFSLGASRISELVQLIAEDIKCVLVIQTECKCLAPNPAGGSNVSEGFGQFSKRRGLDTLPEARGLILKKVSLQRVKESPVEGVSMCNPTARCLSGRLSE